MKSFSTYRLERKSDEEKQHEIRLFTEEQVDLNHLRKKKLLEMNKARFYYFFLVKENES